MAAEKFSFCESVHASSTSRWHIRKLTEKGLKPGGGVDTDSLCGLVLARVGGWDLETEVTPTNVTSYCAVEYQRRTMTEKKPRQPGPSHKIMRVQIDFAIIANRAFHMPEYDIHAIIMSTAMFVCQRILKRDVMLLQKGTVKTSMLDKPPRGMTLPTSLTKASKKRAKA